VSGPGAVEITDTGVWIHHAPHEPVLIHFDDHYVWSFTPGREGVSTRGGTRIEWPHVLLPYLKGVTRVRIDTVGGARVLHDEEHVFGGEETVRVAFRSSAGDPYSIDKVGHLTRSFLATSEQSKNDLLEGTQTVIRTLKEVCGVDAYIGYGALLGAVREGGMIPHDSDTDVSYYSRHTSPVDVIAELMRIERQLKGLGWEILRMSAGDIKILWPLPDGRKVHIDIFAAFHCPTATGEWVFYSMADRHGPLAREDILPLGTVTINGYDFPAPRKPEAMLELLYGSGWRTPDPSFTYVQPREGSDRINGWMRGFRTEMGDWSRIYTTAQHERVPKEPSEFARWVASQIGEPGPRGGQRILDIGTGTGRDAFWLNEIGHHVRAVDYSRLSIKLVRERVRAEQRQHLLPVQLILNETRHVLHSVALLSGRPHHLYARGLIGSLDEAARRNLLLLAGKVTRGQRPEEDRSMFLEFSAPAPRAADPAPVPLTRRFDPARLRAEIEASGGRVDHLEVAPGSDMFGQPDPAVARMRVTYPRKERR
jgi:hypothetical protein